jgi:uncharacterized protein (DUF2336 family)
MIVQHFLKWNETARASERAAAASALARAYLQGGMEFEERCAAEAALTLILDDPSMNVRAALAETLSLSPHAPAQIIHALADDLPAVAGPVLARSPLLGDGDLIDRIAAGDLRRQCFIAGRAQLSMQVAAAIAEVAGLEACLALLRNSGARIAALSFRRLAERFGDSGAMRETLLADRRLPADTRHLLLHKVGETLRSSPFVLALFGPERAERLTRDACRRAAVTLIEHTPPEEHAALVEHLRLRDELSASLIVRTVARGRIDFFAAALVALSGRNEERVASVLASGRRGALLALLSEAALPNVLHGVIERALGIWRSVAAGRMVAGPQEVTFAMLAALDESTAGREPMPEEAELATLLKSVHLELLRENARRHAVAIAAA